MNARLNLAIRKPLVSPWLIGLALSAAVLLITPTKSYADTYQGALFDTSTQTGANNAPVSDLKQDMVKNKVKYGIAYLSIEANNALDREEQIPYIRKLLKALPGRLIPFINQGVGASNTDANSKLVKAFSKSYSIADKNFGKKFVRGFGELDIYGWSGQRGSQPSGPNMDPGVPPNNSTVMSLAKLASKKKVSVMLHPNASDASSMEALLSQYPNTNFLVHQFPEQFDYDRETWLGLMSRYSNLYFSVDADHMLFDIQSSPPIGLLYKYGEEAGSRSKVKKAAKQLIADLRKNKARLLQTALHRYQSAVEAMPDRFMWGSEAGTQYAFFPSAYNEWIDFSRSFIGSLEPSVREKFAYSNALRVFGKGYKIPD